MGQKICFLSVDCKKNSSVRFLIAKRVVDQYYQVHSDKFLKIASDLVLC